MTTHQPPSNAPKGRTLCKALHTLTVAFAVLGLAVILLLSAVLADWDVNAFWFYLVLMIQSFGTVYLSLLTLLWMLTRHARRQNGESLGDKPFDKGLSVTFLAAAIVGLLTVALIPLILADLLHGAFVLIHFACGGLLILLYLVYGIYTAVRRIIHHRRAKRERLAEEKQAWEGYLT